MNPTAEQIEAERERAHALIAGLGIPMGLQPCDLWAGTNAARDGHVVRCNIIATALARRALASLVEAEAVAALHIAPVLIDNGCDCDFEGPHEGLPCEELGHEPCDMCRIERGLNAIRALRGGKR